MTMRREHLSNEVVVAAQAGDRDALGVVMERVYVYARSAAAKLRDTHLDAEDLRQEAAVCGWELLERFDPAMGVSFDSFTYRRMRGAALDAAGGMYRGASVSHSTLSRYWAAVGAGGSIEEAEEAAVAAGMGRETFRSVKAVVNSVSSDILPEEPDPDAYVASYSSAGALAEAEPTVAEVYGVPEGWVEARLAGLTDRQRMAAMMLAEGCSVTEIGAIMGMSPQSAGRLLRRALVNMERN